MKVAKALGLTVSSTILLRADELIEWARLSNQSRAKLRALKPPDFGMRRAPRLAEPYDAQRVLQYAL